MDDLLLRSQTPHNLASWIEEVVGPLDHPLEEISGGAWRFRRYPDEAHWPASHLQQERRKFLAEAQGRSWLVKFAGLGETGIEKLRMARRLHEAGFAPEITGYRHGFLVERWHEDAQSLDRASFDRNWLVEQVGAYLSVRSRHFPTAEHQGASLAELRHMARYNAQQALGQAAADRLGRILSPASSLEGRVRRVFTDNRMHAWEWLVHDTRLIKTDAVDHSAAHDLVGPQDISWDIAGAAVELDLSDQETSRLCGIVQRESGKAISPELLSFMRPCYLAFQLGAHTMAAHALGEGPEATRLHRAAERYACLLRDDIMKDAPYLPQKEQEEQSVR